MSVKFDTAWDDTAGGMEKNASFSSRLVPVQHEGIPFDIVHFHSDFKLFEFINLDKKCETIRPWSSYRRSKVFIDHVDTLFKAKIREIVEIKDNGCVLYKKSHRSSG